MKSSSPRPTLSPERGRASIRAPRDSRLPAEDFVVLDSEAGTFVFAAWKNVLIAVWKAQATAASVERLAKASEVMAARHQGLRSNIHLIVEGAGLPTSDARAAFVRLMGRNRVSLACVAIVIGGSGFWASALRSAMTGLRWLAPRSFDFRLFANNDELVRWLPVTHKSKTGVHLESERLHAILRAVVI